LNEHTLSRRLERVAALVPAGARLADIGSDHAYLPVALMRRGLIAMAVAGVVGATPFSAAQRSGLGDGFQQRIHLRLALGLASIGGEDGIDTISRCGMGGETSRDIFEAGDGRLSGRELLILQPNGGEPELRQWLMDNAYRIVHEDVLLENRFDYEIIVAERSGPVVYSPEALYFGPLLMAARSPAFLDKWQRRLRNKQRTLAGLQRARQEVSEQTLHDTAQQVRWITELLG